LVELLLEQNYEVLNIDVHKPLNNRNLEAFMQVSLLDGDLVRNIVLDFNPNLIIHLAATTKQDSNTLTDFEVNLDGTKTLLNVTNELPSLIKFIFTSSQYVNTPGCKYSTNLDDLNPYGLYGQSKLLGEKMTKEILKNSNWTIIRPTTIWGPQHLILGQGLWKQIIKNRYFHPKKDNAVKAYGYVRNTAWQILKILESENSLTDTKVFYLGDQNISQEKWVQAFVSNLTGRKMRKVPNIVLFVLSELGESLTRLGIEFPLYRSRYRNLITSNPSPLEETLNLLGAPPISFEAAIIETCAWIENTFNSSGGIE
jgi:nucleoside-diphosphate-sugar epimerase